MARLHDDSQHDTSTDILSPQPFAPQGKGFLVSSLESNHSNAQMPSHDYEYNSSSSSNRHSTSDVFGREMDEELEHLKSRASSRSSLSSIPASVLIHPVDRMKQMKQMPDMDFHEKIAGYGIEESEASFGDFNGVPANIRTIRHREAAFRKPSSVRALQMHTEDEADEDDYLTPPRRRAGLRSPGSSPLKRSPYYSPNGSQIKPKAKKDREREKEKEKEKDFPLVLLHCTLLPPSIPVPGATDPRNQDLLEETLPSEYWKRWRRLQDRVGSGVLRDRGVLISHPEDLYDMLEERLLESLELQRPRLQNGHFLGREENDTASEGEMSDIGESETDGEQGDACPDCGSHVRHGDSNRKWEIRVFAANGLMRAGAWAAAWRDMEKVDVEVGLWLPSDVRRALERRLGEESMALTHTPLLSQSQSHSHAHDRLSMSTPQMGSPSLLDGDDRVIPEMMQSPIPGHLRLVSAGSFQSEAVLSRQALLEGRRDSITDFGHEKIERHGQKAQGQHQVALRVLLVNYLRVLAADRRNVALVLLSVLVAFLAIGSVQQQFWASGEILPLSQDLGHDVLQHSVVSSSSVTFVPSVAATSSVEVEAIQTPSSVVSFPAADTVLPTSILDEDASLESETAEPDASTVKSFEPTPSVEVFVETEVLETPETPAIQAERPQEPSDSSVDSAVDSTAGSAALPEPSESATAVENIETLESEVEDPLDFSESDDTQVLETMDIETNQVEGSSPSDESVEPAVTSIQPEVDGPLPLDYSASPVTVEDTEVPETIDFQPNQAEGSPSSNESVEPPVISIEPTEFAHSQAESVAEGDELVEPPSLLPPLEEPDLESDVQAELP
ncbi:uncharacterized protein N7511_008727 [Penicillium nucicola]|uniref:uncharacterized protein n=1 Tax=Penicillium nucicola TaxID=1850975 RepID=UPI00254509E7|nr:uncharacterized protein N7511_008727 [Penicillium nucicola]KAJ5747031.1 hypothetical protein N7511_008727 [Penicillium nucicola]